MSLTLKEAITAAQTTVDVNGTDTLTNGDLYTIEDEQVFVVTASAGSVQPGQTAWQRLNVQRGQLGTTEVAHAAGTAMTPVATPLGGEQTIRLYEFAFAFDDAFVNNDYVVAATIVNAGYVMYSAVVITNDWVGSGVSAEDMSFEIVKNPAGSAEPFLNYDYTVAYAPLSGIEFPAPPSMRFVIPVDAADQIGVGVWPGAGALSAGGAKLVVLIAEPAA